MNLHQTIVLAISFFILIFLVLGGFSWLLQKIDEFENRPTKE